MYLIIVSRASEYQTILFVDAEQTYIQGALDGITRQLQSIYHKNQHAFILNGCQSYLKSSPHYVRLELERWREEGISCGIKLVRGAYMEEERKVAAENNVPSPVWDKIEDTHRAYNGNLQFLLNNMNPDRGKKFINLCISIKINNIKIGFLLHSSKIAETLQVYCYSNI